METWQFLFFWCVHASGCCCSSFSCLLPSMESAHSSGALLIDCSFFLLALTSLISSCFHYYYYERKVREKEIRQNPRRRFYDLIWLHFPFFHLATTRRWLNEETTVMSSTSYILSSIVFRFLSVFIVSSFFCTTSHFSILFRLPPQRQIGCFFSLL